MRLSVFHKLAHALLLAILIAPSNAVAQDPTSRLALLRPGDVVRMKIWREPDLSGDFTIDQTGIVTLPRLGPRSAVATPPDSLRAGIIQDLKRFLTSPAIEVEFMRRVSIGGGVLKPGVYLVDEVMTVADAVTMAGGMQRQDVKAVELVRDGNPTGRTLDLVTRLSAVPIRSGDELRVPRQNWFQQNYQMVYFAISSLLAIATILSVTKH